MASLSGQWNPTMEGPATGAALQLPWLLQQVFFAAVVIFASHVMQRVFSQLSRLAPARKPLPVPSSAPVLGGTLEHWGPDSQMTREPSTDIDSQSAKAWFNAAFGQRETTVPWARFWDHLSKIADGEHPGDERWQYYEFRLQTAEKRAHFQKVMSEQTASSEVTRNEFERWVELTRNETLAEVIELVMRSGWSAWMNGGQEWGAPTAAIIAPAGTWIVEWRVGYAEYSMQIGDTVKHGVKAVASLQGKTNTGIWLPEVKHDGQKAWIMHIVRPVNPQPDFTEMYGLGSGWLTDIMDGPGADDRKWRIDSPSAGVPGGLVVGYQLRTWGPVDAVRFLFQALPDPDTVSGKLLDAVFISHTGADPAAKEFARALHSVLTVRGKAVFYDAATIHAGAQWRTLIKKWATRSKVFVAIISPQFPMRKWPLYEVHMALGRGKKGACIPVLLGVSRQDIEQPGSTNTSRQWQGKWQKLRDNDNDMADIRPGEELRQLLEYQTRDFTGFATDASKVADQNRMMLAQNIAEYVDRYV